MKVRLAFSVAAYLDPEILIIDEVLAVGDAAFQKKCLGKMQDVASHGRTVLFVSHQLGAVNDLCSWCYLMDEGNITASGKPDSVIKQYLDTGQKSVGRLDLSDWSLERRGEGPMRLEYIELANEVGEITPFFDYGKPLVIKLGISGRKGDEFHIGVWIVNRLGHPVMHFTEDDFSETMHLPSDHSELAMKLDALCLNEGSYFITVWLGDTATHDRVGNCMEFTVDTSSLGRIRAKSSILLPASWEIHEAAE
jgi:lipopolysaccharide transport system ATP-binding protein